MGPTFHLLPWLHGAVILALAFLGLAALIADGVSAYRELERRNAADRRHRLARLHDDATGIRA